MANEPQFQPGDRVFSHYTMKWGTVRKRLHTERDQTHGVTGHKLPDSTWYEVMFDGDTSPLMMDDAHGDWDMARIVPPQVAKDFGYGSDPRATD